VIRVSAGTARVLGLTKIKTEAPPTTAYFLVGEKCLRNCGFCARSRSSLAGSHFLSRVTWPRYPAEKAVEELRRAYLEEKLGRVCLQVVHHRDAWIGARQVLEMIRRSGGPPVSVSCTAHSPGDIQNWFEAGAERFGLALDAATEDIFYRVKGGDFNKTLALLHRAAEQWPGKISTHLMVGLGETDRELIARLQEMAHNHIRVGLFAFTPVKGTGLQHHLPPPLARYRRIQAAYHLIFRCGIQARDFSFDGQGNLVSLGQPPQRLAAILCGGEAFRTTGCALCNRPYYNERPGGDIYNYPRPLSPAEADAALQLLPTTGSGR
jgi:biotin synthase